jgi:hypothetical protein
MKQRPGSGGKFASRRQLIRIQDIEHVMPDRTPLLGRNFGCADVEVPVELERIAIDHLPAKRFA